jgi:hypothetical protein
LAYATQGMLEIPGLVMTSLTLVVALKLLRDDQPVGNSPPREWMLLGLLVTLTYLMRPQYGVVVGLALALTLLIHTRGRLWRSQTFYALLPFVLLLGVWFAYTPKIPSTLHWLINVPDGVDEPYSVAGWLFYPLAVVRNSGSPWLFALYMVTWVWVWVKRRSSGVNLLVVLVLVLFTISMFHHNKQARYLFPMLPAFFLLGGYGVAEFWRWARGRGGVWRMVSAVGLLLLLVQGGLLLNVAIQPSAGSHSGSISGPDATTIYLIEQIHEVSNTLVIGSMEMTTPGPPLLDWWLSAEAGLLAPPQAGSAAQIDEGRRLREIATRLPLPAWLAQSMIQVVTSYDQPAPVHTLYVDLPLRASYSQGAAGYAAFVTDLLADQAVEQVLLIYRTNAPRYGSDYLAAPLTSKGWSLVEAERFTSGMTVEVWRP